MVFSSIAVHSYYAFSVSEEFIDDPECFNCNRPGLGLLQVDVVRSLHERARNGTLVRLEPQACIDQYAQMIQSFHRHVLLVGENDKFPPPSENQDVWNGSYIYSYNPYEASNLIYPDQASDTFYWICSGVEEVAECVNGIDLVKNQSPWVVDGYPVRYCLSENAPQMCKLQFIPGIAILVTILNFIKAAIMFYSALRIKENPLMTLGDSILSFLERRDPTTRGMCLVDIEDVKKSSDSFPHGPRIFQGMEYRWKDTTSRARRLTNFAL